MEILILRAKLILSDLFLINIIHFEKHTTRRVDVIEARRFLVYFLREELGMTYKKITKNIPAISNHATAIHHHKKLKQYMDVEPKLLLKYNDFRSMILDDPNNMIEKEISSMIDKRKLINNQIYNLRKLL